MEDRKPSLRTPLLVEELSRLRQLAERNGDGTGYTIVACDTLLSLVTCVERVRRVLGSYEPMPTTAESSGAPQVARRPYTPRRVCKDPIYKDGKKWCPDCADYRPLSCFWANKRLLGGAHKGLQVYCKEHCVKRSTRPRVGSAPGAG